MYGIGTGMLGFTVCNDRKRPLFAKPPINGCERWMTWYMRVTALLLRCAAPHTRNRDDQMLQICICREFSSANLPAMFCSELFCANFTKRRFNSCYSQLQSVVEAGENEIKQGCNFLRFAHTRRDQQGVKIHCLGPTVTERLACSPPFLVNILQSPAGSLRYFARGNHAGRCRWSAGFIWDPPFPLPFHFDTAPCSAHFALIGSQDLDVKSRPNLFIHSLHSVSYKGVHITGRSSGMPNHIVNFAGPYRREISVSSRPEWNKPIMKVRNIRVGNKKSREFGMVSLSACVPATRVGCTPVGTPRPRSRSEGAIGATLTRTPSASSLLRARHAVFP
ncbi:hypothetical protein PR048_033354, partial [Dryococelus australis]